MVNPLVLLSFSMGRLSLAEIGEAAGRAAKLQAAAVLVDAPGLAADVRRPIDVRVAKERLEEEG